MGLIDFGFSSSIVEWLAKSLNLNLFVESGTYHGSSALLASKIFNRVITIEKCSEYFEEASLKLKDESNINCYQGCTRDHLIAHLSETDNPLFWLDAHWSGGGSAGQGDECPLPSELSLIFSLNLDSFAILIDDARLFSAPPPQPHERNQWPRIDEIAKSLPDNCTMYIYNDVIYILPDNISDSFSCFLQSLITTEWNSRLECDSRSTIANKSSLAKSLKSLFPFQ